VLCLILKHIKPNLLPKVNKTKLLTTIKVIKEHLRTNFFFNKKPFYSYIRNLTNEYQHGNIKKPIYRNFEYKLLLTLLNIKTAQTILLLGEDKIGKLTFLEGLTEYLKKNRLRRLKHIFLLDLHFLYYQTNTKIKFIITLIDIIKRVNKDQQKLLCFKNLQNLNFIKNLLKPLIHKTITSILIINLFDYNKYINEQKNIFKEFKILRLKELTITQTLKVVKFKRLYFETTYNILISNTILRIAIK
jgi:ATP-dependent Clp protease ATP-binding subunit ClpA